MNEKELFEWIKDNLIPDLEKTNQFDYTDAYSKKYNMNIELKSRYTHYNSLLIEKMKWDKLIAMSNPRYVNYTPKGIYSFNLLKIETPFWFDRVMPKTTEFENTEKIVKTVGFLDINLAVPLLQR